ncbi:MAG: hypothetical protein NTV57_04470 [Cyanobacteria bacterium]|nr:hypothetical protein [Cyanobacteriota bacterium]
MPPTIDFKRLFKLRLLVARHGEMDAARWWNSGALTGEFLFQQGFPG